MDADRFDDLSRRLTVMLSRRTALRDLAGTAIAGALALLGLTEMEARRKRKKRKKLRRNEFGCVNVGGKCHGNNRLCCSGICKGKRPKKGEKDKSRCVAHNQRGCQPGEDSCQLVIVSCGFPQGFCARTTGKAGFCGIPSEGECTTCSKDTDCEAAFGQGAACIDCPQCSPLGFETACYPPAVQ